MIQSIMKGPKFIKHAKIVDMLENKEFAEKRRNHHNQHQIMMIIYKLSQARDNHSHQV